MCGDGPDKIVEPKDIICPDCGFVIGKAGMMHAPHLREDCFEYKLKLANERIAQLVLEQALSKVKEVRDVILRDGRVLRFVTPETQAELQGLQLDLEALLSIVAGLPVVLDSVIGFIKHYMVEVDSGHHCGPESLCDGICMDAARDSKLLEEVRQIRDAVVVLRGKKD